MATKDEIPTCRCRPKEISTTLPPAWPPARALPHCTRRPGDSKPPVPDVYTEINTLTRNNVMWSSILDGWWRIRDMITAYDTVMAYRLTERLKGLEGSAGRNGDL